MILSPSNRCLEILSKCNLKKHTVSFIELTGEIFFPELSEAQIELARLLGLLRKKWQRKETSFVEGQETMKGSRMLGDETFYYASQWRFYAGDSKKIDYKEGQNPSAIRFELQLYGSLQIHRALGTNKLSELTKITADNIETAIRKAIKKHFELATINYERLGSFLQGWKWQKIYPHEDMRKKARDYAVNWCRMQNIGKSDIENDVVDNELDDLELTTDEFSKEDIQKMTKNTGIRNPLQLMNWFFRRRKHAAAKKHKSEADKQYLTISPRQFLIIDTDRDLFKQMLGDDVEG